VFVIDYLLFLGVIFIVFWLWNLAFTLLGSLIFALIRWNKGTYLIKAFNIYIFVSLTALLTLGVMVENPGIASLVLLPLIGGFIIFTSLGQDAYDKQKEAMMHYDYELLENLKYDGLFIFGALILFVIALFLPIIAVNPLTEWLFKITEWAYNIKILGWILRIGGAIFLLAFVWQGILFSLLLIGAIIGKIKGEPEYESEKELPGESK